MSRKNKLMVAAAIAAVLLLVGSGVARCSLERTDAPEAQQSSEAIDESEAPSEAARTDKTDAEEESEFASYVGTSWVGAEDPGCTLSIVDGAFVEGKDGQNTVTYITLDSEEETAGTLTATVMASSSMAEAATPALVTIAQEAGRTCIKSDALSTVYALAQAEPRSLSFSGVTGKLEEALGVDAAKIEAAVAARAAAVSPNATRAVWDAEVWTDYANDVVTTSFTLEDGAATIVSVTRNADGTVEAL